MPPPVLESQRRLMTSPVPNRSEQALEDAASVDYDQQLT